MTHIEHKTSKSKLSLRTTGLAASFAGAGLLGVLALAPQPAFAATAPSTMAVTSTVQATCTNTITPLAFGVYTGAAVPAQATITVTCTDTTPYTISLDPGTFPGATVATRELTGPTAAGVNYVLTQDAAFAVNWGQSVGDDTVAGTGNGAAQAITIFANEPAGQYVAPGAYTDTITATVTY